MSDIGKICTYALSQRQFTIPGVQAELDMSYRRVYEAVKKLQKDGKVKYVGGLIFEYTSLAPKPSKPPEEPLVIPAVESIKRAKQEKEQKQGENKAAEAELTPKAFNMCRARYYRARTTVNALNCEYLAHKGAHSRRGIVQMFKRAFEELERSQEEYKTAYLKLYGTELENCMTDEAIEYLTKQDVRVIALEHCIKNGPIDSYALWLLCYDVVAVDVCLLWMEVYDYATIDNTDGEKKYTATLTLEQLESRVGTKRKK